MNKTLSIVATAAAVVMAVGTAQARDQISIVGSSTVYPFSTAAAEEFGNVSGFKTPVVESTGSGGGLKLFCAGVGEEHPDVTNASRRIKKKEFDNCAANNIEIVEYKIGFDGIVVANSKQGTDLDLTSQQVFKAFAKHVVINGKLEKNPYQKWSEIDDSLPEVKIEAFGPPPTSGTRDAFVEIAMEAGAKKFPELKALREIGKDDAGKAEAEAAAKALGASDDCVATAAAKGGKKAFQCVAHTLREDGNWVDAGENDNAIVGTLEQNPNAVGVFGFSFLDQNSDKIKGAQIDGISPQADTIADGSYPVSRSLWFYVKKNHIDVTTKPGELMGYVSTFMNDDQIGPSGALLDKGLIPLPDAERIQWQAKVESLDIMTGNEGLK